MGIFTYAEDFLKLAYDIHLQGVILNRSQMLLDNNKEGRCSGRLVLLSVAWPVEID